MDFGTSLLSMPSLYNSSVIAPPQLHSTAMSITNESKKEKKKKKGCEQSYLDQSNIIPSRKRHCRKD
jgi:hypothetical protein